MGYGAMQLAVAGPHVFGPPADRDATVAVLRAAVALGISHMDTVDFYGRRVTNQLFKEALYPYLDELHIMTKVGEVRDTEGVRQRRQPGRRQLQRRRAHQPRLVSQPARTSRGHRRDRRPDVPCHRETGNR
jgi:aryl-alcohol dehydrogenase-like predicted oxidoreductase